MSSEAELLSLARRFDTKGLAEIYDLYSPKLYRYAMRLLGDSALAEDCVSETFSRFLEALNAGKGPRDYLQAYLFRTAHNFIVDRYRREKSEDDLDDNLPDDYNVEETVGRNIRQAHMRAALRGLTPDQQQVIALKFFEGWENEDIARVLDKPVGAVKSLQHRALAHLQKVLLNDEVYA